MRVSTQIAVASVITVAAVVAIALVSHLQVRALEADIDEIAEEWKEMDAITGALAALRKGRDDPAGRAELARQRERLAPFAGTGHAASGGEHEQREIRMFARVMELLRRAERATRAERKALADEAEEVALSFWREDLGRVSAQLGAVRARQHRTRTINIGAGIALLLVPVVVLAFIQFRIARPLARIQASVARVGGSAPSPGEGRSSMALLEGAIAEMVRSVEARRRDLEEQVEARIVQLRHANRLGGLGRIAAAVAHEINTPLGSIHLCLQGLRTALEEQPLPRAEIGKYLATAASQIETCTATTRKLLSYAHLQPEERGRSAAGLLVEEAVGLVAAHCRQRGVTVEAEVGAEVPEITGDLAQLRQVLVNLLLNAADASPRGERVRIEAAVAADGRIAIQVRDHGRGIPGDLREEIFSPFFTTKRTGEGTGLGLSIAREIVEAEGGELLLADSREGVGSTFSIFLPAPTESNR